MNLYIMINRMPIYTKNLNYQTIIEVLLLKEGGYLLSRIALQYHRRK